jgi:transposase InsO family protein
MDAKFRRQYVKAVAERYRRASKAEKGRILDELCRTCGYHRKYAIALLRRGAARSAGNSHLSPGKLRRRPRRPRSKTYGTEVLDVARAVWEASGYPWSVRLREILRVWYPWIRRRFRTTKAQEKLLRSVSASTLDRALREHKRRRTRRLFGRTKPGSLLRREVPVHLEKRDISEPGWVEVDLVSHSGPRASGEFLYSLNLTDLFSGWVETAAVRGKGEEGVARALEAIRQTLPFALRGLHSDNGSEFLNYHLLRYCRRRGIRFTRSRPYKKDDNAHVEQKNWTHVRKLMGWDRYDSQAALVAMNDLYRNELRLWMNAFQPSVKLQERERRGSRVAKRYDAPRTPIDRLQGAKRTKKQVLRAWKTRRRQTDPFELSSFIERKLERIWRYARTQPAMPSTSSSPTPASRVAFGKIP